MTESIFLQYSCQSELECECKYEKIVDFTMSSKEDHPPFVVNRKKKEKKKNCNKTLKRKIRYRNVILK